MGFMIKKMVAPLFYPMTLLVIVLVVGVGLLWFSKKRQKLGKILVTTGVGRKSGLKATALRFVSEATVMGTLYTSPWDSVGSLPSVV